MPDTEFPLLIAHKTALSAEITEFVLCAPNHQGNAVVLPPATPGAHITVATPSGARRRYSITRADPNPLEYRIAVKREVTGRGGSLSLIDNSQVGQSIAVQAPQNEFPLLAAERYLFIAGGIGITPILSMVRALRGMGRSDFKLIYLTRDAEHSVFLDELTALGAGGEVIVHHDGGDADAFYDLWPELEQPDQRHVYVCGPPVLMQEFADMSGHWPDDQLHRESFEPQVQAVQQTDRPFTIYCQRSSLHVEVGANQSALAALRDAGITVASSCESGSCGSCKTTLITGNVEHRDLVLTDAECATHLMLCVSRAPDGGEIVVDL